jgi:hypothetical protein
MNDDNSIRRAKLVAMPLNLYRYRTVLWNLVSGEQWIKALCVQVMEYHFMSAFTQILTHCMRDRMVQAV